jgi:hypothetical protein
MSDKLSFDEKMKLVEQGKIDQKTGKFTSMDAMREAKGFKPGETPAQFNTRRSVLEGAKKTLKATKYGKIAAGVAGAGLALKQYLKSKTDKVEDVDKKSMGGETNLSPKQMKIARMAPPTNKITGADFKAMKASNGKMIMARGCKMGRNKPTKLS